MSKKLSRKCEWENCKVEPAYWCYSAKKYLCQKHMLQQALIILGAATAIAMLLIII